MSVFDTLTPLVARRLRASVVHTFAQAYWDHLCDHGYAQSTVRKYMTALAHFSHWSVDQCVDFVELDRHITRFVDEHLPRCRCDAPVARTRHSVRAALKHFKTVVAGSGTQFDRQTLNPADTQLQRFDQYLQQMKGLAVVTRRRSATIVRPLVLTTNTDELPTAIQLRQFLREELSRVSTASALVTTTAVRNYLRFRAFEGHCIDHLLPIVASPANWRLAPHPETLTPLEVERLLAAFPLGLASRLRGYAIMRCLVDLGLRGSEVINLELDHIDWEAGTVRIHQAKSQRVDILPLSKAAGVAIVDYIRSERPCTTNRRVFVRHVAPVDKPVGADVVRRTVREAYQRADLPYTGVHILRHTLASRLLNTGGTLKEVADVLRHRQLDTSLIYAKVNLLKLNAVVMPWPGDPS